MSHTRPGVRLTAWDRSPLKRPENERASRSPELMNREDSALLVVDAQEKLLSVVPDEIGLVWNIRRLLDAAARTRRGDRRLPSSNPDRLVRRCLS